jgi:carbamoylphosphate synthase large subunit
MACKVLISTTVRWTSTARHAAGFALSGAAVDVIAPDGAPATQSRYVHQSHVYRPIFARQSLRKAIQQSAPDLIVACDDRAVENMLSLYGNEPAASPIRTVIAKSLGAPENYNEILSRNGSLAISRALGISTPQTLPVANEQDLEESLRIIGLPAVLKVDGSWGGDGVQVVRTIAEAQAAFWKLSTPASRLRCLVRAARRRDAHWLKGALMPVRRAVSIQKFVEGVPAASAFAAWNGEIVGLLCYDVLVADGMTGPPSVVRRVACAEMEDASRKIARRFGLSGLFGLDFIRDEVGQVQLIEINPRATQGGTLPFGPGRDLAAALTACVTPDARLRPAIDNDTVVFFPREWLRQSKSPWLAQGYHDVPWDDPAILRACLSSLPPIPKYRLTAEVVQLEALRERDLPVTRAAAGKS